MSGVLLRSGTLQEFRALGVDGQPAYRSALQLREAIRLKIGREAANCLAIPQPSESGDRIDWYAPLEGDVVPWSAATEVERASALIRLEHLHEQLLSTADSMREDAQNREKQLFARLLKMTRNFPDDGHVYLVNDKPVVTFWGFTDQTGINEYDPLLCLRPPQLFPASAAPVAVSSVPAEQTRVVPSSVVPAVAGSSKRQSGSHWWRWLWLLLPLLLLPLLSLLRACAPQVGLPLGLDQIGLPELPKIDVSARVGGADQSGLSGLPDIDLSANGRAGRTMEQLSANEVLDGKASVEDIGVPSEQLWEQDREPNQEQPPTENWKATSEPPPEPEGKPEIPVEQDSQLSEQPPSQNPSLESSISSQALKNGSIDFLNGRWKAGAGIQDAQTGKPLRLDYEFQNGKGLVRVRRGDGVECSGSVAAEMWDGGLAITSQGQARCNDGGSYKLPEVLCKPSSQSAADCSGSYQNQQFPMSMRQDIQ
jgi:hypothetical protein